MARKTHKDKVKSRQLAALHSIENVVSSVWAMDRACRKASATTTLADIEPLSKKMCLATLEIEKVVGSLTKELTETGIRLIDESNTVAKHNEGVKPEEEPNGN